MSPVPHPSEPVAAKDKASEKRPLSPAAQRALAEAAARRAERDRHVANQSEDTKEVGGRDGPEPTRYGDWEINGLTSDF
jgi:hypothetical protein